jgi:hypothetical protein
MGQAGQKKLEKEKKREVVCTTKAQFALYKDVLQQIK